jgi:hypothetical protein
LTGWRRQEEGNERNAFVFTSLEADLQVEAEDDGAENAEEIINWTKFIIAFHFGFVMGEHLG